MATILVVGVDTVVGGNVAAQLSREHDVLGTYLEREVAIGGCRSLGRAVPTAIAGESPEWVVFCGVSDGSTWEASAVDAEFARRWAEAARACGADLTYVSTDTVFDGPRLFHEEAGETAPTPRARAARLAEEAVLAEHSEACIVRTRAFGWSPVGAGWIESLLAGATTSRQWHATPIHAGDLADVLAEAWSAGLRGIWHAGGGERTNPVEFADRLRDRFDRPAVAVESTGPVRETSLRSTRLARALERPLPMLETGIARLFTESELGYPEALAAGTTVPEFEPPATEDLRVLVDAA